MNLVANSAGFKVQGEAFRLNFVAIQVIQSGYLVT